MLAALALLVSACANDRADPDYTQQCSMFVADPDQPFFAVSRTYRDRDLVAWPTVDPATVGLNPVILEKAAEALALSPVAASLLVVRDGKLAFERYFNGFAANDANNVHSLSKSVLSVLTGIAIDDGYLTLESRIGDVLPAAVVGEHGALTVRDLVTMSGGVQLPEPEAAYEWEPGDGRSFVAAVLEWPRVGEPGVEFAYSTGLTQVLAAVLTEATGTPLCEYAADRLLGPTGIDVEDWHVEIGGYFAGGHSLFLTPRELARFGQVVADHGTYDGERIVSERWLSDSLSPRWELGCIRNPPVAARYGYLWWAYRIGRHDVWVASGFGGQDVAIIDDLDLVVVITHDTAETDGMRVPMPALLYDVLLAAVEGDPQPELSAQCSTSAMTMASVQADGSTAAVPIPGVPTNTFGLLSPDGDRLAYAKPFAGSWDLYTSEIDGTDEMRITRDGAPDAMPAWSPDARVLAFARGEPAESDLYRIAADGSGLRRLTRLGGYEQAPTWSPDGERIAFIWGHENVRGWGHAGELWVINADGSGLMRLRAEQSTNPAWSPDGRKIAFDSTTGDGHIGVVELATGTVNDLGEGFFPRWSPDGTRLAFGLLDGLGGSDVFTMAADGTDRVRLTHDAAFDTLPQWSPAGTTILFGTRANTSDE